MHSSAVLKLWCIIVFASVLVNGDIIRNKREVCQSEECQAVSDYILSKLNTSVDPCQDMYQFSCGRWPDMSKVGKHVHRYNLFDEVDSNIDQQLIQTLQEEGAFFRCQNSSAVGKLKDFYRSCVNLEYDERKVMQPFIEFIDSYGSWTVSQTKHSWNEENWNLQKALSNAHKLWGTSFWTMTIERNRTDLLRNTLRFKRSGLTSPDENYNSCSTEDDFMKSAIKIGWLLGGDKKIIKDKMSSVLTLERQLAQLPDQSEIVNVSLGEFQKSTLGSWINIEDYLEGIFGVRKMNQDDQVIVESPDYFGKLKNIIEGTSKETLANYVMWNLIMNGLQHFPEKISNTIEPIYSVGEIKQKKKSIRKKKCLESAKKRLPLLTGALFVDKNISMEIITKIVTAIDDIEHEFIQELQKIQWLDEKTRKALIEKAKSMSNQVGYPDWLLNPEKLDAKYENLVIDGNDFLENMIRIIEFHRKKELNNFFKTPERKIWSASPADVNAYYYALENEMVILAGILQPPLVSPYYPRSYVYGGIGTVLGHELVHGFDNRGRFFNKDGIQEDTWTPHVAEEFVERALCYVDQYSTYRLYNISVNGYLTLGENIADNGGMKIAYRAYQSSINQHDISLPGLDLTDDQLFFVGMSQYWCGYYSREYVQAQIKTDKHSPGQTRVIGSMSNSKEFAEAFKCEKNSPMNPEKKCELW